jgi:hypothetical protein
MLRRVAFVRTEVSEERRFLQQPHGMTSQKKTFFNSISQSHLFSPFLHQLLPSLTPFFIFAIIHDGIPASKITDL